MSKTIIIAEAGVNHNGSIELAKKMIEVSKEAGADYIKFQTFISENLVTQNAEQAEYQKKEQKNTSQLEMLKTLELTQKNFVDLAEYCKKIRIGFLSTPFDLDSIKFLKGVSMDYWKIPSGEITDYPYLDAIARDKRNIILSIGMSTLEEVSAALKILEQYEKKQISILHCNTEYPTPYEDVNLNVIPMLKEKYKCPVGYSDHTVGIEVPIAAVAMGAEIIEKHFTLDRNMEGPDHKASLEPRELSSMIKAIRNIEKAIGVSQKIVTSSEKKNINVVRKSVVAKITIQKGERFTEENITTKRPGTGISPMRWNEILGKVAKKEFQKNEQIEL